MGQAPNLSYSGNWDRKSKNSRPNWATEWVQDQSRHFTGILPQKYDDGDEGGGSGDGGGGSGSNGGDGGGGGNGSGGGSWAPFKQWGSGMLVSYQAQTKASYFYCTFLLFLLYIKIEISYQLLQLSLILFFIGFILKQ